MNRYSPTISEAPRAGTPDTRIRYSCGLSTVAGRPRSILFRSPTVRRDQPVRPPHDPLAIRGEQRCLVRRKVHRLEIELHGQIPVPTVSATVGS